MLKFLAISVILDWYILDAAIDRGIAGLAGHLHIWSCSEGTTAIPNVQRVNYLFDKKILRPPWGVRSEVLTQSH